MTYRGAKSQPHSIALRTEFDPVDNAHPTGESSLTGPGGELVGPKRPALHYYSDQVQGTRQGSCRSYLALAALAEKISANNSATHVRPEIRLDRYCTESLGRP